MSKRKPFLPPDGASSASEWGTSVLLDNSVLTMEHFPFSKVGICGPKKKFAVAKSDFSFKCPSR